MVLRRGITPDSCFKMLDVWYWSQVPIYEFLALGHWSSYLIALGLFLHVQKGVNYHNYIGML